ncbi:precorrin-6A/cobalt-precorrin-6A reductase [Pelagimonas varians]|uniref:Precorrin-6A reductase n=2 Tax=Pelagimonas varians TaxID=696760 RepID=A0A238KDI1_9RHOB|nr:precorrin-6A/cobalt-precorrin-6A reductase [Pelagimonas varians]SMX40908.1 Precorrin-6A reductase [Pelagimonas varians]
MPRRGIGAKHRLGFCAGHGYQGRMHTVFIIGGSAEAWRLARALPEAVVWLPEAERVPRAWPCPVQTGDIQVPAAAAAVVVAPHPCDARAACLGVAAARRAGVPCLQVQRRGWSAGRNDRWTFLRLEADAAQVIEPGARVLTTLGRGGLPKLAALNAHVLARRLRPDDGNFPLKYGRFIDARGPFHRAQEQRFLRKERIDWLLLRNAGGPGGRPKLDAARDLGLRVAMVARSPWPGGARVGTIQEALRWLDQI